MSDLFLKPTIKHQYLLLYLLIFVSLGSRLYAQSGKKDKDQFFEYYRSYTSSNWTLSFGSGVTVFQNDLHATFNGKGQNNFMNLFGSGTLSYRMTNFFSFQGSLGVYQLYAKPEEGIIRESAMDRNPVVAINAEVYFGGRVDFTARRSIDYGRRKLSPYLIAGIGLTLFEPKDAITNEKLRPANEQVALREGKYLYSSLMPTIPMGAGIGYYFHPQHAVSLEGVYRHSFSDWMDDTYGRVDAQDSHNDGYFFVGVHYHYTFKASGNALGAFNYKRYRKRANKRKR